MYILQRWHGSFVETHFSVNIGFCDGGCSLSVTTTIVKEDGRILRPFLKKNLGNRGLMAVRGLREPVVL